METYRLFAAVRPPENIVQTLTRLQKGVPDAKWSDPEKFHITLGYFGDLNAEQAELLDQHLAAIRQVPFEVSLSGTGHYGRAEPHSIWVGVKNNPALSALAKSVRKAARDCRIALDKREFQPHVTLAYLRAFPDVASIASWEHQHSEFTAEPFWAEAFYLQSSWRRRNGANRYDIEASYPLLA